jgi:two-component system, NarL family, sensor histidine kinase UhpB
LLEARRSERVDSLLDDPEVDPGLGEEQLPSEVATALHRIVQEALTNVVKHAQAGRVSILVTRKNGDVALVIEDDGRGFDPESPAEGSIHGMRERAELLGGALRVESREGAAGTTLAVEVSLP